MTRQNDQERLHSPSTQYSQPKMPSYVTGLASSLFARAVTLLPLPFLVPLFSTDADSLYHLYWGSDSRRLKTRLYNHVESRFDRRITMCDIGNLHNIPPKLMRVPIRDCSTVVPMFERRAFCTNVSYADKAIHFRIDMHRAHVLRPSRTLSSKIESHMSSPAETLL